ncbi:hypothetical protein MHF_1438 [Mycoplasma haemofelis Ohio2]|uniref:Uncharacterized protein n=1 Tax=Mycoplasma haemofelis (strain Ohio2) TaxID=859194 RepID=F6FGW3_MYCHI|nr:hypothetical protein MHF_1438 [Mycoplasma haemofelis Ohio2]
MPSSSTIKVASGLGAAGAIGGGVALSKPYLFPNKATLRSLVEADKWKFLSGSNSSEISEILATYKSQNPSPFANFKGDEGNKDDLLLEKCKELSEKYEDDANKEEFLRKLKRWCVIPKSVQDRLSDFNITPMSTEDPSSSTNEDQSWISKMKSYESSNSKFSQLASLDSGTDDEKAKKLRTRCKDELNVKSFTESFEVTLDKVKLWCVSIQKLGN